MAESGKPITEDVSMHRCLLIRIVLCLSILLSVCPTAQARPHHSSSNHVQAQSDSGSSDEVSTQGGETAIGDQSTGTTTDEPTSGPDSGGTVRVNNLANLEAL